MTRQKELEGMSDFEINCEVAKILGLWYESQSMWDSCEVKDYCNNPNDIMPLAIENGITLQHLSYSRGWYAIESVDVLNKSFHKNPYRAACIVLILIKESEL